MKVKGTTVTRRYGTQFDTKTAIVTLTKTEDGVAILAPQIGIHKNLTAVSVQTVEQVETPDYAEYYEIPEGLIFVEFRVNFTQVCMGCLNPETGNYNVTKPCDFTNQKYNVWMQEADFAKVAKFVA